MKINRNSQISMVDNIVIKLDDKEIFVGKIQDIPVKEEAIREASIKMFADDDPCIIHKSFVILKMILRFIDEIKCYNSDILDVKKLNKEIIYFIDLQQIENTKLYLNR